LAANIVEVRVGSDKNIDELEEVVDSVMFEMVLRLTG
jgi:hypothetical protein